VTEFAPQSETSCLERISRHYCVLLPAATFFV
jgi:hypothetical protein